jgi:acetyl esterase/lipase
MLACALIMLAPSAHAASRIKVEADVPYARSGATTLRLDSWSHRDATARRRPIIVLLHGGGWRAGRRSEWAQHGWAQSIAATGYVVIAPSYRLACPSLARDDQLSIEASQPGVSELCGHSMGEQRQDIVNAVRWSIRNARRLGGDPDRIVLLGGSAGGHLALLAAAQADIATHLAGVAAISPPVDLTMIGRRSLWLRGNVEEAIRCSWSDCPARWAKHSPLIELQRAPTLVPTYLYASRGDVRVRRIDVLRLAGTLRRRGASVTVHEPIVATSGCHGPWSCERFAVAGVKMPLRRDVLRWIGQVTRPSS